MSDTEKMKIPDSIDDNLRAIIEAQMQHIAAEAWDEGFNAGSEWDHDAEHGPTVPQPDWTNPYRTAK